MNKKIYLIGGAPGAGKTTLATALAIKLGIRSLTIDDLVTAVQAVTTPSTHPGLHLMWNTSHTDYFTNNSPHKLIADAKKQHEVAWPFIESVIQKYANQGISIVIDGWHLWPDCVAQLAVKNLWAGWIVIAPEVLEERERNNIAWVQGSTDPDRMLTNFLARSFWCNNAVKEQATSLKMNILFQNGNRSVDELIKSIMN